MKTITEFSGIILRQAAEALSAYRTANPPPAAQVDPTPAGAANAEAIPAVAEEAADAASSTVESASDATDTPDVEASSPVADEALPEAPPTEVIAEEAPPPAEVNFGIGPEAEAVGTAMGLEGDRLTRLMEALNVAGKRVAQVRLIRVVASETAPEGAQKCGEFYFVLDQMPRHFNRQESDQGRGGRGDDRRGGRDHSKGGGGRPNHEGGGQNKVTGGKFAGGFAPREEMGAKGDVPRAGAGWMLTRAPEERRAAPDHRRGAHTAQDPRKDFRGNRADGGRGAGQRPDGRPGERDARGPRPQGPRPPQGARPPQGQGPRPPQGPRPDGANQARPNRPSGGGPDRGRDQRHEGGNFRGPRPQPRRAAWDEPLVVDRAPPAAVENPPVAVSPAVAEPGASSSSSEGNT